MLKKLTIEQFVIIDKLELDFQPGLTILTGETGAGKSILLDAMGLILGEPSSPDSIRQGATESTFTARFAPPAGHPAPKFLIEQGLAKEGDPDFLIKRVMYVAGNDDITINGNPVDVEILHKLGTFLVEIHGQFANQSLLDPANQLNLLDLSGNFPPEVFKNVADALDDVHRYTRELEEENIFLNTSKRDMPTIERMVGRFDKLGMRENFVQEATDEYARLLTAKETSEAFQDILAQLIAANGVVMTLSSANNILNRNKNLEAEKVAKLSELLGSALNNSRAAVVEMRRIAPEYDIDLKPLEMYKQITRELQEISKESKVPYEELEEYYNTINGKLKRFRNGRQKIAELQDALIKAKNQYRHHAHILTEKRMVAGEELSKTITAELAPLKLNRAEFKVLVEENANLPWTKLGLNQVTFTARMNPGQPFSPVSETASGGELARLILALKVVVQRVQTIPTLVFDEVDTGIGGAAAAAVGERIAQLADSTQVLVITHSPQVASRNHQHLHVSKKTDGVTTQSVVRMLSQQESIDEISRMLAGDVITAESQAAAKSLMDEAKNAAEARRQRAQA